MGSVLFSILGSDPDVAEKVQVVGPNVWVKLISLVHVGWIVVLSQVSLNELLILDHAGTSRDALGLLSELESCWQFVLHLPLACPRRLLPTPHLSRFKVKLYQTTALYDCQR